MSARLSQCLNVNLRPLESPLSPQAKGPPWPHSGRNSGANCEPESRDSAELPGVWSLPQGLGPLEGGMFRSMLDVVPGLVCGLVLAEDDPRLSWEWCGSEHSKLGSSTVLSTTAACWAAAAS